MASWVIDYINWTDPMDIFTCSRGYIYKDGELVLESLNIVPGMKPLEWSPSDTLDIWYWYVGIGYGSYRDRGKGSRIAACLLDEFLYDMTPQGMSLRLKGLPGLTMARLVLETARDYAFLGLPAGKTAWS